MPIGPIANIDSTNYRYSTTLVEGSKVNKNNINKLKEFFVLSSCLENNFIGQKNLK